MFFALIFTLKEKRQHKSDKEFENEEKRKSAVTFVTALFFLVAGTGISRPASQSEWTSKATLQSISLRREYIV
jgi:hypothetical protein